MPWNDSADAWHGEAGQHAMGPCHRSSSVFFKHNLLVKLQFLPRPALAGKVIVLGCLCLLMIFVTFTMVRENDQSDRYETFKIDHKWYWDNAYKFSRWQHPATGCGVMSAVGNT